jgi:hypothetical protein
MTHGVTGSGMSYEETALYQDNDEPTLVPANLLSRPASRIRHWDGRVAAGTAAV